MSAGVFYLEPPCRIQQKSMFLINAAPAAWNSLLPSLQTKPQNVAVQTSVLRPISSSLHLRFVILVRFLSLNL